MYSKTSECEEAAVLLGFVIMSHTKNYLQSGTKPESLGYCFDPDFF